MTMTYAIRLSKVSTYILVSMDAPVNAPSPLLDPSRGDLMAAQCPSREVLRHMTSQWGVLVLVALQDGTHRFSELRKKIGGVSERMLAQTLKLLESDGLVRRVSYPVVPPHTEYSLTDLGHEAAVHVRGLAEWVEAKLPDILAGRAS
jgi:DNA-binding HxlR family transcriptional regulator